MVQLQQRHKDLIARVQSCLCRVGTKHSDGYRKNKGLRWVQMDMPAKGSVKDANPLASASPAPVVPYCQHEEELLCIRICSLSHMCAQGRARAKLLHFASKSLHMLFLGPEMLPKPLSGLSPLKSYLPCQPSTVPHNNGHAYHYMKTAALKGRLHVCLPCGGMMVQQYIPAMLAD